MSGRDYQPFQLLRIIMVDKHDKNISRSVVSVERPAWVSDSFGAALGSQLLQASLYRAEVLVVQADTDLATRRPVQ